MFGLPTEVIVGFASALGGFIMKQSAQKLANEQARFEMQVKHMQAVSSMADAAAKRSSPWLRKFAAIVVLLVAFVGTLAVAFMPKIPVSVVYETATKSFLGIFKWGGNLEVLQANGFVIQEWFKFSVISIVMFLFGSGAAKIR